MASVECPVCRRQVSDETGRCPLCLANLRQSSAAPSSAVKAAPPDVTVIKTNRGTGGKICGAFFWCWGIIGLLGNTVGYFGLTGAVGVGSSAYASLGMQYWIGGMVLFGFGSLLAQSEAVARKA